MAFHFANCILDPDSRTLTRAGTRVHVEPQVFDVLACLVAAQGALVSYDALIEAVWDGRIVSDATLATRISAARTAVGDDGKRQAVIRTLPRRGIQLVVAVTALPHASPQHDPTHGTAPHQTVRYTASRDGTALAWAEHGSGPPLLRGGHWLSHLEHDWTSPVWRPMLDRLGHNRRLIRYDARGTGLSERSLNDASLEALADDMEAVADAAGLERFPIYAASQSVPVALTFAARRPDRVSRMILFNGFVQGTTTRGDLGATETMVSMVRSGWGVPGSAFMKALATVFMPLSTPEEVQSLVEMQALSATAETAAALRLMIGSIDAASALPQVTCPVLVLHSSGDAVQSAEQSKLIARSLVDAEIQLHDSPNHIIVPSDPIWGPCQDAVDRFLAA